jgi:hypothetical protein
MLFQRWRWHNAAKVYGERLGRHLAAAYGGEPPYTVAQVNASILNLELNPHYAALGYAAFIAPADYARLRSENPQLLDGEVARVLMERYGPWSPAASDTFEDPRGFSGISDRFRSDW